MGQVSKEQALIVLFNHLAQNIATISSPALKTVGISLPDKFKKKNLVLIQYAKVEAITKRLQHVRMLLQ